MPLFDVELNRIADDIGATDLTIFLQLTAPTDLAPTSGRTTAGGGFYAAGATLAASDISTAVNGDIENTAAIPFRAATADVGTVIGWSAFRGVAPVGHGTLPSTTINSGDSFEIDANSLQITGSTT